MTLTAPPRPRAQLQRRRLWVAGAVTVAALGFLLLRGLGDATVYFKTADEAVAQRARLGHHRFRIEGVVAPGTVHPVGEDVAFTIRGIRAAVAVVHRGDPPELFQPDIPVVLEGRFEGDHYASDRIMVKHTAEYRARNPDRVDDYVGKAGRRGR